MCHASAAATRFISKPGLKLYDWISGQGMLSPSRFLSIHESMVRLPMLNTSGLVGTVAYTDGQFDDARYGIALLKTFARTEAPRSTMHESPVLPRPRTANYGKHRSKTNCLRSVSP